MPGKACDKYTGKEKQDCLNYRGRFAKMPKTQKPISSAREEQDIVGTDIAKSKNVRMKNRLKKQASY